MGYEWHQKLMSARDKISKGMVKVKNDQIKKKKAVWQGIHDIVYSKKKVKRTIFQVPH